MVKQTDAAATNADFDETPVTISFTVPAWVVERRGMTADQFADWVRLSAACYLYSRADLSMSTAARLAGLNYAAMMDALKEARIPSAGYEEGDLERELAYLSGLRLTDLARG